MRPACPGGIIFLERRNNMEKIKNANDLKKVLGKRIRSLTVADPNISSLGIDGDTLRKYKNGQRYPQPEFLVKIKNHYDVPFAYLFGDTDNKDIDSMEISYKLGLTSKATHKIIAMNDNDNQEERELQLFALNQLIENIDFLELGKLLLIPNETNKNIKSEKIYKYYSDYVTHGIGIEDYYYTINSIDKIKDYNDYLINKRLFELFDKIRNSEECANVFINYVDREQETMNTLEYTPPEIIDEKTFREEQEKMEKDMEKFMDKNVREVEIRNKQIIEKRQKDLKC